MYLLLKNEAIFQTVMFPFFPGGIMNFGRMGKTIRRKWLPKATLPNHAALQGGRPITDPHIFRGKKMN